MAGFTPLPVTALATMSKAAAIIVMAALTQSPQDKCQDEDAVLMLMHTDHGMSAQMSTAVECRNAQEQLAMGRLAGQQMLIEVEDGPDALVQDITCVRDFMVVP